MGRALDLADWDGPGKGSDPGLAASLPPGRKATPALKERMRLLFTAEVRDRVGDDEVAVREAADVLAMLGLSTRDGQVLVRFGEQGSRVRVYVAPDGLLHCQWCLLLAVDFVTGDGARMAAHLGEHQSAGHVVPEVAYDRLASAGA